MLQCNFQCLLGMECSTFAILAADQITTQSIVVLKNDEEKLFEINDKILLGVNGEAGEISQFADYVEKNVHLYKLRNGYDLSTEAVVHFTRKMITESTHNGVNVLVGGYSEEQGGQLYFMDYMGSCVRMPFAAHGFAGLFTIGVLGNEYNRILTLTEAYAILKLCVREIQQRMFLNLGSFQVKAIDKNGIIELPIIK